MYALVQFSTGPEQSCPSNLPFKFAVLDGTQPDPRFCHSGESGMGMGMIDGDGGASPPSGKGDKGPVRVTGPIGDGDRGVRALGTVTGHDSEAQTVSSVDSHKADSEQAHRADLVNDQFCAIPANRR